MKPKNFDKQNEKPIKASKESGNYFNMNLKKGTTLKVSAVSFTFNLLFGLLFCYHTKFLYSVNIKLFLII